MKSMKTKILSLLIAFPLLLNAQINLISHFTWDNNPVSQADFGPDATSISASSFVDINGANNTNGLNAGNNPKKDINLILPGYHFDVDGIEVEIDFQREENSGNFFARGNCLKFGISSGKLRIQYRLSDGMGGYVQHTYTNLFSVPFDDTYRTYTFRYDPYTQEATVSVNSVEIWSKTESGQPLYWNGAGDMLIGSGLDGTGFNKTFLDNSKISEILPVILPVQFQILSIEPENSLPKVKWETVFEKNNSHFLVEKSYDGQTFEKIGEVSGAGNSNSTQQYSFLDENYNKGDVISGLENTETESTKVFHAGTSVKDGKVVTNGGRVLCAVALGNSVTEAQHLAYQVVNKISWNNVYYRTDIGHRAIDRENSVE